MLSILLTILSSTGFGSLIGAAGGLFNRYIDLKNRDKDLELQRLKNDHELAVRDKDLEQAKIEAEGRVQVAIQEKEGQVESAAYGAMAEALKGQFSPSGAPWVDAISRLIRPAVTLIFVTSSLGLAVYILFKAFDSGVQFTVAEWKEWVTYVVQWVFFQAGIIVGFWFAHRSGSKGK